jgi:hypothetical protein
MASLAASAQKNVQVLEIAKEIEIAAPIDIVYESLLEQLGPLSETPDGEPLLMTLEAWPGGRLYRDLGGNAGWCWGHVQVIEPPTRLEIWGSHFMSYPVVAHFQYLLSERDGLTLLKFNYRVIGMIEETDRVNVGRCEFMQRVRKMAESRSGAK